MKNLFLFLTLAILVFACSSGPSFKDKVNENAYQRIGIGQTYDQVLMTMGGLESMELAPGLHQWQNGDISNSTYSITVSIEDGKVVRKSATTTDEKGKLIKEERYPE
jgi:major membrane immunogen (membrane-anchored lipoprotein)